MACYIYCQLICCGKEGGDVRVDLITGIVDDITLGRGDITQQVENLVYLSHDPNLLDYMEVNTTDNLECSDVEIDIENKVTS